VFGSAPPEHADDTAADEKSLRGMAEKLARETISGFAEEKLNAPAVGNALKADRDFMNEVASSLESALASSEDSDAPDLPENASGGGADLETYVQPVQDSGLDMKLKEALAADARTSETIAAEQKEDALSAETAALVVESMARDERPGRGPAETAQRTPQAEEAAPVPAEASAPVPPKNEAGKADLPASVLNLPGSLEGSIKEMIKPLIIQWLNENLPRIVEEAVREELTGRSPTDGQRDRSTA
jgi:cell pole-organizing protein PopZ